MATTDQLWREALTRIEARIGQQNFTTWIKPIRFNSRTRTQISLDAPNRFARDWVVEHYQPLLEEVISSIARDSMTVSFNVAHDAVEEEAPPPRKREEEKQREQPNRTNNLIPKYTFENFVVGSSNQFAHAACQAVSERPSKAYNPLFLYGGVGMGKTHLMQAIGHEIKRRQPQSAICYISSEKFTNEMINSLRYDRMISFRDKFRNVDVLLIDDIQFLAQKERTQEEFFHTFNAITICLFDSWSALKV